MKSKHKFLTSMITVTFLLSACGPVTIVMPTDVPPLVPSNSLPDLVVSNIYLGMQGVAESLSNCVPNYGPYEIRATIQNLGQTSAYNIPVVELSTGTELQIGELAAGQSMELYFPATSASGTYSVNVDLQNAIPESNENNNTFSYLAPTPTPPALCTPTISPVDITPVPQSDAMIIWQGAGTSCRTASFWPDHMTYSFCPPDLPPSQWPVSTAVYSQLPDYANAYTSRYSIWARAYAPFTAQTRAGTVTFNGGGYVIATAAEQRMIAEWASYMFSEIPESSTSGGGLVIAGHLSGDNSCFDIGVYRDGRYKVSSCLAGFAYPAPDGYLDANELIYFYDWLDRLQPYQAATEPGNFLILYGDGFAAPETAEKISIETMVFSLESRAKGQGYTSGGGLPTAVFVAQRTLAQQLGIPLDQIQIKGTESIDYPDSCLGAPKSNEVCVQEVTPGLRVQLVTQGLAYEFHTDLTGYSVRQFGDPQPAPQGAGG